MRYMLPRLPASYGLQVATMKKKSKGQKAISKVMREYKAGTLNSGSKKGPKVKNRKQAIAIALSEGERASRSKKRRKK